MSGVLCVRAVKNSKKTVEYLSKYNLCSLGAAHFSLTKKRHYPSLQFSDALLPIIGRVASKFINISPINVRTAAGLRLSQVEISGLGIGDEENECIAATADLNLNLGRPSSPSSCSFDMSSDLSSISLTRTLSSDSNERGDLRNEILPFDLNHEPCEETEGLSIVESMPERTCSQQSWGPNVRQQAPAVVAPESSEKEVEEQNRRATNFECNICFDITKEPVVTSCGHLFCWPCLYLWLHVHSNQKECPVCKREVTEASITPIYGRGCSRSANENKDEENSVSGISIPWRPRGNRLQSRRQNFDRNSRFVEDGIENSWRLHQNYQIHNRSGFIGRRENVLMDEMLAGDPSILTSSMTRRIEEGNTEDGPTTMEVRFQREYESVLRDSVTESIPNEIDTGRGAYIFPTIDSLVIMNSMIERTVRRYTENTNFCGPSSSVNSPNPGQFVSISVVGTGPSADQASASTAVTEIINECSARDDSTEPHSGGSSIPYRRIRRSSSSSSSDDDGNRWTRKRTRLP